LIPQDLALIRRSSLPTAAAKTNVTEPSWVVCASLAAESWYYFYFFFLVSGGRGDRKAKKTANDDGIHYGIV